MDTATAWKDIVTLNQKIVDIVGEGVPLDNRGLAALQAEYGRKVQSLDEYVSSTGLRINADAEEKAAVSKGSLHGGRLVNSIDRNEFTWNDIVKTIRGKGYNKALCVDKRDEAMQCKTLKEAAETIEDDSRYWNGDWFPT
jgi:hypothetical protein